MKLQALKECYRANLPLDLPPTAGMVFRSNNNMVPQLPGSPLTWTSGFDCDYPSQDVIIVGDPGLKKFVLVGALTAHRSLTYLTARRRSNRMDSIVVEQPEIKPGEEPEQLMITEGEDWQQMLLDYARAAAAAMGVKPIDADKNLIGYCTWYYYYADVSEQNFLDNLDALQAHPESPFSHGIAQIDDGYQTFQGDWLDQDPTWPTPLKDIAQRTADKGLVPGIWLMPMVASTASRTYREHEDWFVKNDEGENFVFQGWSPAPDHLWACIDPTRPEVREHLTHVFKTFWNWGFRYFKLDGLGFGLPQGHRHDPNATAVSAFRLALKTIREAVPDGMILGCCPPYMACLGYCDSCRVSGDTGREWLPESKPFNCDGGPGTCCIKNAYHASAANWWMYDRWFRCDPDTLMARQDNAWYSLGEARISVLSGIMSGVTITSDNLATIEPERQALLDFAARTRLKDVKPLNWEPGRWCQTWEGTIKGHRAVAFVNDTEKEMTFKLAESGIDGQAEELLQGLGTVREALALAPHDAALLMVK